MSIEHRLPGSPYPVLPTRARVSVEVPTSPGYAWLVPFNLHSGGRSMLRPGDKAPDFVGRDHNGKTVKLSDFAGKPVVLWFFPKADTPG